MRISSSITAPELSSKADVMRTRQAEKRLLVGLKSSGLLVAVGVVRSETKSQVAEAAQN